MNHRADANAKSSKYLHVNLTPEADARIRGMASYDKVSFSHFVRELPKWWRGVLVKEGKKPPLKPRGEFTSYTGPRALGEYLYRHIRVSQQEHEETMALAQYMELPCNEMIMFIAEKKRKAMLDAGQRPPVRPPAAEGGVLQDSGIPTPRRKR